MGLALSGGVAAGEKGMAAATDPERLTAQALAFEHGEGVPKDQLRAAALYCDAAREGDAEAMFRLGWMYANGRGVARDDALAAGLFTRAAGKGHLYARKMLTYLAENNDSIPDCMRPVEVKNDEEDAFSALPPDKKKIAEQVSKIAQRYAVNPRLALAIATAESNFQPDARSVKNALGIMQLIPETAARFKVRNRLNIDENVRGGVSYLRWLLAYYQGRVSLAVAAYNAGEAAVDKYRGIPPYPETRDYVRRVRVLFRSEQHPYDPTVADPSPILRSNGGRK